ncbi:ADP-ribose pyrophosphatase YjhB (NUDIX family) [Pseudonocardia sediminis]|uniref:ADP-ribose pyrophosphatase YjhB (NUDIX family) n=2 Tax=Pseudonocardia sediminis TaxID=1397368 RepID=A0A4Q7UPS3_PSEST|nr:ADP-ribose pyrophosphatase YjhB (NUDIX family) [Pseudonocardia sediminis]
MADTPKHSVSVAGIVVDEDDRVLVIQRRDNAHWEPPGGILELDESPEDGVCREVFEETGVSVAVEELSGVYKNMTRGIIALVFRCRRVSGEPTVSDESRAVAWRSIGEIVDDMDPAFAIRVQDALSREVYVRCHDGVELVGSD